MERCIAYFSAAGHSLSHVPHFVCSLLTTSYWYILCQTIRLVLKDSYLPKAFSISRALSKCPYTHAHSRPMIDGLNLLASSRDTCRRSTTESLIIGG